MASLITPSNLDTSFDIGTNIANKISLKIGTGLSRLADGTIAASNNNIVYTDPSITVHNGVANSKTSVVNTNIVIVDSGDYMLNLSFNYNINSTNSYGKWFSTFNGGAIDLNDRNADAEGQYQILVTRVRNAGNTNGGAITGTGSGNKFNYSMQFLLTGLAPGTYPFTLDCGNQTANVNTSTWNIIAKFELL